MVILRGVVMWACKPARSTRAFASASPNASASYMLMNLLAGLITGRIADGAPDRLRSADLFDAATIGGAKALGRSDLGHLSPGARADIAIFRLDDVFMLGRTEQ